jgi:hypothetical protein
LRLASSRRSGLICGPSDRQTKALQSRRGSPVGETQATEATCPRPQPASLVPQQALQQAQALPFARRGPPAGVMQAESKCRVRPTRGGLTRRPASTVLSQPWRRMRSSPSPPGARPTRLCVSVVGAGSVTRVCPQSTRAIGTGSPQCCRLRQPSVRRGALRVRRQPLSLILWSAVDTRARKRSAVRLNLGPCSTLWINCGLRPRLRDGQQRELIRFDLIYR